MNITFIKFLIVFFSGFSYLIGFYYILKNEYKPSLYTRTVFLAISINNLVSVYFLSNQKTTLLLSLVTFLGSLIIFISSIFRGDRTFNKVEKISSMLLFFSLAFWMFFDLPLLNLFIGLLAHSIGSVPTVVRAIKTPSSENFLFWFFFFLGSLIALFIIPSNANLKDYVFVVYFVLFDGILSLLTFRKFLK